MNNSFFGIEMGKRGLVVHTKRIATVGHNLSNMSTEGYSRQRVEVESFEPLYRPHLNREERPGQIGQGVEVAQVRRIHDDELERRVIDNESGYHFWKTRSNYVLMLEQLHNEPTEQSLRFLMDKFWDAWQELSIYPEQLSARQAVLQRGKAVAESIRIRGEGLVQIRQMLEDHVVAMVQQINEHIRDIAALNEEIVQVKAEGDNPNDLLDKRDLLVKKLAQLIDISTEDKDADEFNVYSGGYRIVQGKIARMLKTAGNQENDGYSAVFWKKTGEKFHPWGGSLQALLELRDKDVLDELKNIDQVTITLVNLVNEIHQKGYGLNGRTNVAFFTERNRVLNVQGNYDSNGDGIFDQSLIFRMTGSHRLQADEQIGLEGIITLEGSQGPVTIAYHPTDTMRDIMQRINGSGAEIVARLNRDNMFELRATPSADMRTPDFVIRHIEDSGELLVGYAGLLTQSGLNGRYRWDEASSALQLNENATYGLAPLKNPSVWIDVNSLIVNDSASIVAGFVDRGQDREAPGDGDAALSIAQLRNRDIVLANNSRTFDSYFADIVAEIGLKGEEADLAMRTRELIVKKLDDTKKTISGVNLDEELSNMLKYQRAYQSIARFITTYDGLMDTIINRMMG